MAEDDKDHTIWSSSSESESGSLAHLVLREVGVGEGRSSDEEGDEDRVDMMDDELLIGLMDRRGEERHHDGRLFIILAFRPDRGGRVRAAPHRTCQCVNQYSVSTKRSSNIRN
jgi:hypothetical protein